MRPNACLIWEYKHSGDTTFAHHLRHQEIHYALQKKEYFIKQIQTSFEDITPQTLDPLVVCALS